MSNLDFVKKLYNGKNCYSDHMEAAEMELLHIPSRVEAIVADMLRNNKLVFLTGNPGDGKTFIIKALKPIIDDTNAYVETDMNNVAEYGKVVDNIVECFEARRPAVIAVNEYPFLLLMKQLRSRSEKLYAELNRVRREAIAYDISAPLQGHAAIVDLNERNLLAKDSNLLPTLLGRFLGLLSADDNQDTGVRANITALQHPYVQGQLMSLLQLAASSCEHYAVRDLLGAFSFILTACTMEDFERPLYYDAPFMGNNALLKAMQEYDPVYLSKPELDELLWNGELTEGWLFGAPEVWPNNKQFEENEEDGVEKAVELFKTIKRRFYFENTNSQLLTELQPAEVKRTTERFVSFEAKKKVIKGSIIRAINKIYLPNEETRKQLYIWTTHRFDLSQEPIVSISSRSVDAAELELLMPHPSDWLNGMEYTPDHMLLRRKHSRDEENTAVLYLDVDFLHTLDAIDNGYPVGLIPTEYEQAISRFMQQLNDCHAYDDEDDGRIILANRQTNERMVVSIVNGKFGFEEDE